MMSVCKCKLFVACTLFIGSSAAMAQASDWPAACGSDSIQFKVKTEKGAAPDLAPDTAHAKIVFIQSLNGAFPSAPTARFAVDGKWLGATRGNSYFVTSVAPGAHSICASRQASAQADKANRSTATIQAQPGQVYYVEFTIERVEIGNARMLHDGGSPYSSKSSGAMEAAQHDTTDTVSFARLDPAVGATTVQKRQQSSWTQK